MSDDSSSSDSSDEESSSSYSSSGSGRSSPSSRRSAVKKRKARSGKMRKGRRGGKKLRGRRANRAKGGSRSRNGSSRSSSQSASSDYENEAPVTDAIPLSTSLSADLGSGEETENETIQLSLSQIQQLVSTVKSSLKQSKGKGKRNKRGSRKRGKSNAAAEEETEAFADAEDESSVQTSPPNHEQKSNTLLRASPVSVTNLKYKYPSLASPSNSSRRFASQSSSPVSSSTVNSPVPVDRIPSVQLVTDISTVSTSKVAETLPRVENSVSEVPESVKPVNSELPVKTSTASISKITEKILEKVEASAPKVELTDAAKSTTPELSGKTSTTSISKTAEKSPLEKVAGSAPESSAGDKSVKTELPTASSIKMTEKSSVKIESSSPETPDDSKLANPELPGKTLPAPVSKITENIPEKVDVSAPAIPDGAKLVKTEPPGKISEPEGNSSQPTSAAPEAKSN